MQLEFFGAAGEVAGSCHVLRLDFGSPADVRG